MFTTPVSTVLQQMYAGLTQKGITMMVSKAQLIEFMNYSLSEIYAHE